MIFLELPENTAGRDFIVSDIHGYFAALEQALAAQQFDAARDRVIAVGDLVDRGPQSARALEFLAQPWFFSVRGNHEQAMLEWLVLLLADAPVAELRNAAGRHAAFGGDWAMPLLTAALRGARDEAQRWHTALAAMPLAIALPRKGKHIGVVHATVPGGDWNRYTAEIAGLAVAQWENPAAGAHLHITQQTLWARRPLEDAGDSAAGVTGIDQVFAGHNVVPFPRQIGNFHMIETAAWMGQSLTLVNLDDWPPRGGKKGLLGRWLRGAG